MKTMIVCILLFLSGCAVTSGKQVSADQLGQFKVGVTTREDIVKVLGAPTTVLNTPAGKMLMYSYHHSKTNGATFIPLVGAFIGGTKSEGTTALFVLSADGMLKSMTQDATQMDASLGTK